MEMKYYTYISRAKIDMLFEQIAPQSSPVFVSTETLLHREHLIHAFRILDSRFSESEVKNLCFVLGVRYDDLPGTGKKDKTRELIAFLDRHGRFSEFLKAGKEERPDINWQDIMQARLEISAPPAPGKMSALYYRLQSVIDILQQAGKIGQLQFESTPPPYVFANFDARCSLLNSPDRLDVVMWIGGWHEGSTHKYVVLGGSPYHQIGDLLFNEVPEFPRGSGSGSTTLRLYGHLWTQVLLNNKKVAIGYNFVEAIEMLAKRQLMGGIPVEKIETVFRVLAWNYHPVSDAVYILGTPLYVALAS